jgi:peptidyl-prolyl cis-trans isomerase D
MFVENTPADFVAQVFEMEPNEIRVISDATGAWIVRLDQVTEADQNSPEAQALKGIFGQQGTQALATDVLQAFTQALIATKGVEINQTAINAVHANFP